MEEKFNEFAKKEGLQDVLIIATKEDGTIFFHCPENPITAFGMAALAQRYVDQGFDAGEAEDMVQNKATYKWN
jgi:hypothetical protein